MVVIIMEEGGKQENPLIAHKANKPIRKQRLSKKNAAVPIYFEEESAHKGPPQQPEPAQPIQEPIQEPPQPMQEPPQEPIQETNSLLPTVKIS
jgi:hypothetical protein